jgi:phosphate transport system permease protein
VTTTTTEPANRSAERRAMVQASAAKGLRRRIWLSRLFLASMVLALLIAFVPLFSILDNVIAKGAPFMTWQFLSQSQQFPSILQPTAIGGVWNAISGSLLIDGLAIVIAVPIALTLAVSLFEFENRLFRTLRICLEVMIGLPSILLGIFIYSFVVIPISHGVGTAYAGSLAIALMMVPLIAIAAEAGLRDVPVTLKEAGLALGAKRSSIMRRVIMPFAVPRVLTGILLAISRAVGETAPILFVIGVSLLPGWNPNGQATSLPVLIWNYLGSQYPGEREACWGIALILIAAVLVLNLASRIIVAMTSKGRQ